jgi:hypothetical protein
MANTLYWIGATSDSLSKYDWNVASNWCVERGSGNTSLVPAYQSPQAGDTVYFGHRVHALSPCLFGGYSGSANSGSWLENGTTGSPSQTVGITNGGVNVIFYTDSRSINETQNYTTLKSIYGLDGATFAGPTGSQQGPYVYTAGLAPICWNNITREKMISQLMVANPHAAYRTRVGSSRNATWGQGYYINSMSFKGARLLNKTSITTDYSTFMDDTNSRYPFPLGGQIWDNSQAYGVSGPTSYIWDGYSYKMSPLERDIQNMTSVYQMSYWGYDKYNGATNGASGAAIGANRAANAWVGGGLSAPTGYTLTGNSRILNGLKLRITSFYAGISNQNFRFGLTAAATDYDGGKWVGPVPQSSAFSVVADKDSYGAMATDVRYDLPHHSYNGHTVANGVVRSVQVVGNGYVRLMGLTAGIVNSDLASSLFVTPTSRLGGVQIYNPLPPSQALANFRYNSESLRMLGNITSSARTAVWGSAGTTAYGFPQQDKILLNLPQMWGFTGADKNVDSGIFSGASAYAYNSRIPQPTITVGTAMWGGTGPTSSNDPGIIAYIPIIESYSKPTTTTTSTRLAGEVWQIRVAGSVTVNTVNDSGSLYGLASPWNGNMNSIINIGVLNGKQGTVIDLKSNPNINNIFFGGVTGTGYNARLVGGLVCGDDTVQILPSAGIALVNTKILFAKQDSRATLRNGVITLNSAVVDGNNLMNDVGASPQ